MRGVQQPNELFRPMEKKSDLIPKLIPIRYIIKPAPKNQYNGMETNGAGIDKN
jgi:hypothetical protein